MFTRCLYYDQRTYNNLTNCLFPNECYMLPKAQIEPAEVHPAFAALNDQINDDLEEFEITIVIFQKIILSDAHSWVQRQQSLPYSRDQASFT